jgi:PEP-CTERM motif
MKFTLKTLSAAAALLAMGAANATLTSLSVGDPALDVVDPNGSGRTASVQLLSAAGVLTFTNQGATANALDASKVDGAVGALNTGGVILSAAGGLNTQETWKSYASSGPGFESVVWGSKTAADNDPANAPYYAANDISPTNTGSFRLASAAGGNVSILAKVDNAGNDGIYAAASVGQIATAAPVGSMSLSATANAALTGGNINVSNITFDLYSGQVTATVSGNRLASGKAVSAQTYDPRTLVLWTFAGTAAGGADISGPTGVDPDSLLSDNPVAALTADGFTNITAVGTNAQGFTIYEGSANTTISNLTMTTEALTFFKTVLNTNATGSTAIENVNNLVGKWGTVTSNLVMRVQETTATTVPEPSTYALMGLGLVGISLVARRRRAAV